ncbi:type II toxin-antitoxin system VapC family toxin [Pseudothauera rhizosphaerae]|nr:type II toxin-antitoxin system VapC family toxin [Pseudothauera rhizosphaerae]
MSADPAPLIVAENLARYVVEPPLVVDCSVLAALLFDEPERPLAAEHLNGRSLHAPWLLDFEIASVAAKKATAGAPESARLGLQDYASLDLNRHATEPLALLELARRYRLTVYDAAYLWLADVLGAPLATFDQRLGRAAQAHLRGDRP